MQGRAVERNFNVTLTPCGSRSRRRQTGLPPPAAPPPPLVGPPAHPPSWTLQTAIPAASLEAESTGEPDRIRGGGETRPRSDRGQGEGASPLLQPDVAHQPTTTVSCSDMAATFSVASPPLDSPPCGPLWSEASSLLQSLHQQPGTSWTTFILQSGFQRSPRSGAACLGEAGRELLPLLQSPLA